MICNSQALLTHLQRNLLYVSYITDHVITCNTLKANCFSCCQQRIFVAFPDDNLDTDRTTAQSHLSE